MSGCVVFGGSWWWLVVFFGHVGDREKKMARTKKEGRQQGFWERWCWEEKKKNKNDRIRNEKETTKTTKEMKRRTIELETKKETTKTTK